LNNFFRLLLEKFRQIFRRRPAPDTGASDKQTAPLYRLLRVEDLPDQPEERTLYLAGEEGFEWGAAMVCPCGCKETIQFNLLREVRPRWTIHLAEDGVSLAPSVWRSQGCHSHFFLRHGQIEWCETQPVASRQRKRRRSKR
jgi:hypothetical protein